MCTVDERLVAAPVAVIFALARDVRAWPERLAHYRYVEFDDGDSDHGGLVRMSANRPFGPVNWPTWWRSLMAVDTTAPALRFRHVNGITTGMEVEWSFTRAGSATRVRVVHAWNGPRWPVAGGLAARTVIGPVFVHGIASRTLAGLARVAEREREGSSP